MLERYIKDDDRIQRLFVNLAEQNKKAKQEKDKQKVNGEPKPGNPSGQGGGQQGTLSD